MKRSKQYIVMATAIAMLFTASCQQGEVIDSNDTSTGELKFSPSLGEAETVTRAGESDNDVLQKASAAGGNLPHIVIETYTGTPGSSLQKYFSDELGYFESEKNWDINSKKVHFLPSGGMHLYAYFATDLAGKGKLDDLEYIVPSAPDKHPSLTFEVAAEAVNQVDLIAAKVEEINSSEVLIPFRHILSQINFGVKGMDGFQITVKNIRINAVKNSGIFDYKALGWTPDAMTTAYPYHFPNRVKDDANSGLGDQYKTQGTPDDSQNIYLFGDGGKFGPGDDAKFLYAQTDPTVSHYATKEDTPTPLHNSLMLLPQEITKNTDATVTFDYEIRSKGEDKIVRSSKDNTVRLDAYYDWEPNLRYVYLFKFSDTQVAFDVLVEPWQYYDGEDGIIGSEELNSNTLFQKVVRSIKPTGSYSVPLGPLISDFICDWSQYTLDNSFVGPQSDKFELSFDNAPFKNSKSVIIKPPFGFKATPSSLQAAGTVTFTPITSYYSSTDVLNTAITSGTGNHEFYVNDKVSLADINFVGSETAESSLTLHSLTPYSGAPTDWQISDGKAVYYPNDFALTSETPYSYTVYTVGGLKAIFDWMNNGGTHPGGSSNLEFADRMKTNITLAANAVYDLAKVYKANASDNSKDAFVPIGNSSTYYAGNFDGKDATIENLYINTPTADFQGFFGAKNALVQNLNFINVSVTGNNNIGGIAGLNAGNNITNCTVSGEVTGNYSVGGIAGANWNAIIGCGSSASVSGGNPGGIVGNGGFVTACYSTGDVTGFGFVGGITATNEAHHTTIACYSTSTLGGSGTKGAIVGNSQGTTSGCYYVAASDINNQVGTTCLPSIAVLNGKIPLLNSTVRSQSGTVHFVSGNLNDTPPSIAAGNPDVGTDKGVLKGTFIQNWFALGWDQKRWNDEMAILATVGMEYLVIDQVMEFSDYQDNKQYMSWYPAGDVLVNEPKYKISGNDALVMCMKACQAHNIKLFIGTFFDKRYWNGGAATIYPDQWHNCIKTANNVMNELTAFYFNGASSLKGDYTDVLAGWYFPYEVDDLNFQSEATEKILKDGITLAMECRNKLAVDAKKPYLFSPFMNGNGPYAYDGETMDAGEYAGLWSRLISSTGFQPGDILSPQDCIGIGKLTLDDLKTWMPALKAATSNGVKFWINVEVFGQGLNASYLTMQQIPASYLYVKEDGKLISFSYPIHYSPESNRANHNAYKAYYDAQ